MLGGAESSLLLIFRLFKVLRQMIDALRHLNPRMHPILVHGNRRCGKSRIRKGAYRDGDTVFLVIYGIMDCRATLWTEIESNLPTLVAAAYVLI